MLDFTANQEAEVIGKRRQFNADQKALAARNGGQSTVFGNAYTVPLHSWETIDKRLVYLQRAEIGVFADIASAVGKPARLGKSIHMFGKISGQGEVNGSMDGRSRAKTDQAVIDYEGTPLPIYDTNYSYGWRDVQTAMDDGGWDYLDAANRDNAYVLMNEKLEDLILNGDSKIKVGGTTLTGLRNAPGVNTGNFGNFDLATATAKQWVGAVDRVMASLRGKKFYRGVTLYVNSGDYASASLPQFADTSGVMIPNIVSILQTVPGIVAIVPSTKVPANEILALVKERHVVEVLNGMPLTTIPVERRNFTDEYTFQVFSAVAGQFKRDADGNAGYAKFVKGA